MALSESLSLARYGFNKERAASLKNFSQQLESYALHVIEDRPVSNLYSYFVDRNQIYIDENKKTKLHVDPEERGGLSLFGTERAIGLALLNPGKLIFFYSPPGPVAFERGTKYDQVKPYTDGQLYLLVGNENNKVDAIAVSVGREQEKQTLDVFFGRQNTRIGFDSEIDKIKYFLSNPLVSDWDIEGFLTYLEGATYINDFSVYKNVHGEEYRLSDIVNDLVQGWFRKINPKVDFDYYQLFQLAQKTDARDAYIYQLKNYFPVYGKSGKMTLGGGCGGSTVTESELSSFDPMEGIKQITALSSDYRLTTSLKDILKKGKEDSDEYGSLKFHCPVCNSEHTRPRHVLLTVCPNKTNEKGEPIPIPKC